MYGLWSGYETDGTNKKSPNPTIESGDLLSME